MRGPTRWCITSEEGSAHRAHTERARGGEGRQEDRQTDTSMQSRPLSSLLSSLLSLLTGIAHDVVRVVEVRVVGVVVDGVAVRGVQGHEEEIGVEGQRGEADL